MDINTRALALARTCYPGIGFSAASATELPFAAGQFDRVVTWTVLQHIPPATIDRAVAEIVRVLRPGGSVILCEETRVPSKTPEHTWHRSRRFYEERFAPLRLAASGPIAEIDRIPGRVSLGEVMQFIPGSIS